MDLKTCQKALKGFAGKRVLVVGDYMLDEHLWGTAERISPEAPVMVVNVDRTDSMPGGAANVAMNICAFGGQAVALGVVGDDEGGVTLRSRLGDFGVDTSGLIVDKNRLTTRKTRIWASHRQQVVRVDRETRRKIPAGTVKSAVEFVSRVVRDVDAVIISDYDKGVVTREVVAAVVSAADEYGKVTTSNPKPRNTHHFAGIGLMQLNQPEASAASGVDISEQRDVEKAGKKVLSALSCRSLLITRGPHGMTAFDGSQNAPFHIPAIQSEDFVYDSAGAGDTVISALTLALTCGVSLPEAAVIANCAAGAVVRKVGVATTTVDEVTSLLKSTWDQQLA